VLDAKLPLQQISCFSVQTCQHAQTHKAKIRMVAWRQSKNKFTVSPSAQAHL